MKNEHELVEKALSGNHAAFESLLNPHRSRMLNLAFRMTGDEEEAREICQDAMMKIYKYLGNFQQGRSFKNWTYKIVTHTTYDFLRRKKKHINLDKKQLIPWAKDQDSPEKMLLNREIKEKLKVCLGRLTPKEKIVFLLRDVEGLSIKETVETLGGSSVSIRVHLSRARQKIREQFEIIYPKMEVKE